MAKVILNVPDISCEHCVRTVTQTLTPIQGVRTVAVDLPTKRVNVDYDERLVSVERMADALQEEDYPVASSQPA